MGDIEGAWTEIQFSAPFNPVAIRLSEIDYNWYVMKLWWTPKDRDVGECYLSRC